MLEVIVEAFEGGAFGTPRMLFCVDISVDLTVPPVAGASDAPTTGITKKLQSYMRLHRKQNSKNPSITYYTLHKL